LAITPNAHETQRFEKIKKTIGGNAFMSVHENDGDGFYSPAVEALVAVGAAVATNNEACFKRQFSEALNLGISRGDIALAIATARKIKESATEQMMKTAGEQLAAARSLDPQPGACCCGNPPSPKNT
jgi:hypothetical protein